MKNISANLIVESIQKVTGKGPHQLHEPLFFGKEMSYLKNTINQNFVSSAGEYVNKFENKIKEYTKAKFAIGAITLQHTKLIKIINCMVTIHPRRCPILLVNHGIRILSTMGAQR